MSFINRLKYITTGKTALERKQEKAAESLIRKKAFAAKLRARQEQAIKFAEAQERLNYKKKLKQLKNPKRYAGFNIVAPEYTSYGTFIGSPRTFGAAKPIKKSRRKSKRG